MCGCAKDKSYIFANISVRIWSLLRLHFKSEHLFMLFLTQAEYYFTLQAFPLKTARLLICLKIHLILGLKLSWAAQQDTSQELLLP